MNSYLKDIAKIPLYSENSIPYAETEDDLASKSVPDENPLGIGRISNSIVESATSKRKDSLEQEFDIISDEEVEEIKGELERKSYHAPHAEIYYHNQYPGAGENIDQHNQLLNGHLLYNNNFQAAGVYHAPQEAQSYPAQNQPSMINWAFGKPLVKRIIRGHKIGIPTIFR